PGHPYASQRREPPRARGRRREPPVARTGVPVGRRAGRDGRDRAVPPDPPRRHARRPHRPPRGRRRRAPARRTPGEGDHVLAAGHRITVDLRGSPDGVTAQAWLPGQLLAPPPVHRTGLFPGRAATATLGDAAAPAAPGALPSVVRGPLGTQPATAPVNGVPA